MRKEQNSTRETKSCNASHEWSREQERLAALVVGVFLAIAAAVIAEASLSFLGLGQQPPAPSWGSMLNTAKNYIDNAPWMAIWPGLSIFLLVLSFNLVGDGLRDALDPRSV